MWPNLGVMHRIERLRRPVWALAIATLCALALVPATADAGTSDGPTAKQAKRIIKGQFDAIYRESWMDADDLKIEFKTFDFLAPTKRKIYGGYYDKPVRVWPLKSNVLVTQDRGTWGLDKTKRGWWQRDYPGGHEVFYFYRQTGGGWNFVTGSP